MHKPGGKKATNVKLLYRGATPTAEKEDGSSERVSQKWKAEDSISYPAGRTSVGR